MAFKQKSGYKPTFKQMRETKEEHSYPGFNNPLTPDTLYTSEGKGVATSQIDESMFGESTKTDSLGQFAHYKDGEKDIKYYYNKPK